MLKQPAPKLLLVVGLLNLGIAYSNSSGEADRAAPHGNYATRKTNSYAATNTFQSSNPLFIATTTTIENSSHIFAQIPNPTPQQTARQQQVHQNAVGLGLPATDHTPANQPRNYDVALFH